MARHIPGPLYFDQHGTQGLPMIFLQSTPDDHRLLMYQTARFSSWFRTIAVDLAGQCLDHFSPPAQQLPHVQYYAPMVCELNNPSTLGTIIAMNEALYRDPEPDSFFLEVTTPTIIISGTADRNHEAARALHQRIPRSIFKEVPNAGHAVMQEAPWLYDDCCIEFLARLGLWPGEPPQPVR